MVATETHPSNLLPTTPPVLLVCLLQIGLVLIAQPLLSRMSQLAPVRRPVAALSAVLMTVYLWHMPAVALLVLANERILGPLPSRPDAAWWWGRPLWLCAVLVLLAGFVAVASRFEASAAAATAPGSRRLPAGSPR
jgi:hypothetical protein